MPDLPDGTVTFLFTDIEGSTRRWQADAATMREAVDRHLTILRDAVADHGGVLYKVIGDATQVAFPTAPSAVQPRSPRNARCSPSRGRPPSIRYGCAWRCTPVRRRRVTETISPRS